MASYERSDDERHKLILDAATDYIIENLDPVPLLDVFQKRGFLQYAIQRDIKDKPDTSEKNRAIIEKVRCRGADGYRKFKEYLKESGNEVIAENLEARGNAIQSYATSTENIVGQPTKFDSEVKPRYYLQLIAFANPTDEDIQRQDPAGDDERHKLILDAETEYIIENLDPVPLLDVFQKRGFLQYSIIRDIKDKPDTSEKNRAIIEKVRCKVADDYRKFKECLKESGNGAIAVKLEAHAKQSYATSTMNIFAHPTDEDVQSQDADGGSIISLPKGIDKVHVSEQPNESIPDEDSKEKYSAEKNVSILGSKIKIKKKV